jgi:hypothetical protein
MIARPNCLALQPTRRATGDHVSAPGLVPPATRLPGNWTRVDEAKIFAPASAQCRDAGSRSLVPGYCRLLDGRKPTAGLPGESRVPRGVETTGQSGDYVSSGLQHEMPRRLFAVEGLNDKKRWMDPATP